MNGSPEASRDLCILYFQAIMTFTQVGHMGLFSWSVDGAGYCKCVKAEDSPLQEDGNVGNEYETPGIHDVGVEDNGRTVTFVITCEKLISTCTVDDPAGEPHCDPTLWYYQESGHCRLPGRALEAYHKDIKDCRRRFPHTNPEPGWDVPRKDCEAKVAARAAEHLRRLSGFSCSNFQNCAGGISAPEVPLPPPGADPGPLLEVPDEGLFEGTILTLLASNDDYRTTLMDEFIEKRA